LAGKVVQKVKRQEDREKLEEKIVEETEGGILHWGREIGPDLEWFRQKIREPTAGGRPKCSTRLPAVAPSRWKPCAWAAKRLRWISTR
jgi:hypothetical protein